ncbi:helix-turn-helix domain-containing protein [Cognatishimia sp. MH4019]|uniref:helix-turn-helix domain-containing protein n=1 Tax=Cognatishimia sp. MH4019 TaxID=2854030 RepID=UPI001CD2E946|nr:helix-turn-helix transcriptional regulator [Cognatishimia sp. MH4019]
MKLGFGERIRTEMKLQGYSEAMLSEALGVRPSTYNNWLNERSEPSYQNLISICAFLQLNLTWVLTGKGPIDPPDNGKESRRVLPRDDFRAARREENARKTIKDSLSKRARALQKEVAEFNAAAAFGDHIDLGAKN